MKDIPAFTTENGVASLVLQEIPYTKNAYVSIHSVSCGEAFVQECMEFCRAVGASTVYAKGHPVLEKYPYHTAIWQMEAPGSNIPKTDAVCTPVTEQTLEQWCGIYNQKMGDVPNAAYMGRHKAEFILNGGCFVWQADVLLGIGMVSEGQIDAVASLVPGGGQKIVSALCHKIGGEKITLQVASENPKAIALYERMGFQKTDELSRWYKIFEP